MEDLQEERAREPLLNKRLDGWVTDFFIEASKWAKFLSITGYVFVGLMLISMGFMFYNLSVIRPGEDASNAMAVLPSVVIIAVYCFPIYYLLKFSSGIKRAVTRHSQDEMEVAFRYLKSHYRFAFIMLLVSMLLPIIVFLIGSAV